jgi:hypothetical protein
MAISTSEIIVLLEMLDHQLGLAFLANWLLGKISKESNLFAVGQAFFLLKFDAFSK